MSNKKKRTRSGTAGTLGEMKLGGILMNNICFKKYKGYSSSENINRIEINKINILIGKNNSGKSSIIDILEYCCDPMEHLNRSNLIEGLSYQIEVNKDDIEKSFLNGTFGGDISGYHNPYGQRFLGCKMNIELIKTGTGENYRLEGRVSSDNDEIRDAGKIKSPWTNVARSRGNPFKNQSLLRLLAERDIRPELDTKELSLRPNGEGVTNLIHKFINFNKLDSKKVEFELLGALNEIMNPDTKYSDIVVQQVDIDNKLYWEIYLEESNGRRIPLSQSGSGLKTILLVLANLILMPLVLNKSTSNIIFAFEELENNLHPSLQRNLFQFISNWILKNNSKVFFTTHSNIVINTFEDNPEAYMMHVLKENDISTIRTVNTRLHKTSIINDLDFKASDILQSNGVIWVEGPSDRIYIKKWIELMSENKLKENSHYQIMFYGGRLLSHLCLESDDELENDFIDLLLLNRNSIIIIDSDKRARNTPINDTKKRIQADYIKCDQLCWITKGKEIENYLSADLVCNSLDLVMKREIEQYETIDNYLDEHRSNLGRKFLNNKVGYAQLFSENIKLEHIKGRLDLENRITEVICNIARWNNIQV